MFALEHDRYWPGDDHPDAELIALTLRFKLAFVAMQFAVGRDAWLTACQGWMLSVARHLELSDIPEPGSPRRYLAYLCNEQLGRICLQQQPETAAEHYLAAAEMAEESSMQVDALLMAAVSLGEAKCYDRGLRVIDEAAVLFDPFSDPLLQRDCTAIQDWLRHLAGASELQFSGDNRNGLTRLLSKLGHQWLTSEQRPGGECLEQVLDDLRGWAADDDIEQQFRVLLTQLRLVDPQVQPQRWQQLVQHANELLDDVTHDGLRVEYHWLKARAESFEHPLSALQKMQALWPQVEAQCRSVDSLTAGGQWLDALNRTSADINTVFAVLTALQQALDDLLTGCDVRSAQRVIDMAQRPLESAVATCAQQAANLGMDSKNGQSLLVCAWDLICKCRQVASKVSTVAPANTEDRAFLTQLNRTYKRGGLDSVRRWEKALITVLETELRTPQQVIMPKRRATTQTADLELLWFQFRELFSQQRLILLYRHAGQLGCVQLAVDAGMLDEQVRQVWRTNDLEKLPALIQPLAGAVQVAMLTSGCVDGSLLWQPDGVVTHLPVACFPSLNQHPLGEAFGIAVERIAVDCTVLPKSDWLGIGAPPAWGVFQVLPGADQELQMLAEQQCQQGRQVTLLSGADCTVENAIMAADRASGIVHFACHGVTQTHYAEGCALVIAVNEYDNALLCWRDVLRMDFAEVELIVLSACSSAAGISRRSGRHQGMAAAFLAAGAAAVLASHYPVDDRVTQVFMTEFYRQLPTAPLVNVLQKTRQVCRSLGVSNTDIAAWSLYQ